MEIFKCRMIKPKLCKPETRLKRTFGLLLDLILRVAWLSTRLTSISANALTLTTMLSLTEEEPIENWGSLKVSEKGVADDIQLPDRDISFGSQLRF